MHKDELEISLRCGVGAMKKMLLGIIAVALIASGASLAQGVSKPADASISGRPGTSAARSLTVSGRVANDGKTFLTDIDTEWEVSNADALKGYEGQLATVKCYIDSERNRIHVLSVKAAELKYASRQGDSAFRR